MLTVNHTITGGIRITGETTWIIEKTPSGMWLISCEDLKIVTTAETPSEWDSAVQGALKLLVKTLNKTDSWLEYLYSCGIEIPSRPQSPDLPPMILSPATVPEMITREARDPSYYARRVTSLSERNHIDVPVTILPEPPSGQEGYVYS